MAAMVGSTAASDSIEFFEEHIHIWELLPNHGLMRFIE
jgi:hypothetical protein